jgi:hypothetical protein
MSFLESSTARDILLEIELESLENQGFDANVKDSIILKNIAQAVAGRRLAVTDKSYIGLVPTATQRGDNVCVLYGFTVPFILRRKDEHYTLVGNC